ncbi:MAG: hypothetical protein ACREQJ_09475, partial [Candidatus Binatia bacterium]
EALPLVAAAFLRGEISWSQTRLLCAVADAVADADSEALWLARANSRTVRDLVLEIRRSRARVVPEAGDTLDDESDATDGEERARFAILCPPRVTLLWRRAIELARRMLGSQAPVWQAAEAIVAEASSEVPIEVDDAETPREPDPLHLSPLGRGRAAGAGEGEPTPAPDVPNLAPFSLDAELRELVDWLGGIDAELGVRLRRVVDLRLHRALGFDSFDTYARERLGLSPAKARALVMLERRARDSRELGRAYRSGELSWVKALAILPVAKGAFESAWVARAREVMVRRLQDEVEWTLDMQDAEARPAAPPESGIRLVVSPARASRDLPEGGPPDLQTCARPILAENAEIAELADRRVTFFGPESVVALFRAGVRGFTAKGELP